MNVFELSASLGLDTSKFSEGLSGAGSALSGMGSAISATISVVRTLDGALTTVSDTVAKGTVSVVTSTAGIAKAIDSNVMGAVDNALGVVVDGFEQMAQAGFSFFESVVQEGMSFDAAMGQVSATLLKTRDDFDENMVKIDGYQGNLRDYAKLLGATTQFTATQAGQALNYMALAGYNAQKSAEMLPGVLNLAAAGAMDLGTASDVVTDAITALGIKEQEVTTFIDQMAKMASSSNTSVSQLGDALLSIGATGRMVTGGFTELNLVLGVLANNGIKASEGGNMLRRLITRLVSPTKEAQGWLDKLGVSVYDASGKMKALPELFQELGKALSGLSESERNVAVSDLFGQYALAGANALLGTTAESWNGLQAAIDDAAGSAEEMAKIQRETLPGSITILQSALSGIKIELFDKFSPTLKEFVNSLSDGLSEAAEEVSNGQYEAAFIRLGNTAADLITQGINLVLENGETINEFIVGIVDFIERVGSAVFTGGSEVLPQLLGHILYFSSLLISSFAEFLSNPENVATIEDTISHLITQISTFLDQNQDELYTIFSTLFDIGIQFVGDLFVLKRKTVYTLILTKVQELLKDLPDDIKSFLDSDETRAMAENMLSWIGDVIESLISGAESVLPELLDFVLDIATLAISGLADYLNDEENVEKIRVALNRMIHSIDTFLHDNAQAIFDIVSTLFDLAVEFLPQVFKLKRETTAAIIAALIRSIFAGAWFEEDVRDGASTGLGVPIGEGLAEGVSKSPILGKNLFRKAILAILGFFTHGFEIRSPSKLFKREVGAYLGEGIVEGIREKVEELKGKLSEIANKIKAPFTNAVGKAKKWGTDMIDNFVSGITEMKDKLGKKAGEIASVISSYLHFSLPEKGALSTSDEWMPDFMQNLADGIDKNRSVVRKAIEGVSQDMSSAMLQDFDVSPKVTSTYGSTKGKVLNVDIHIGTVNGASAADAQNLGNTISEMIYNKIYRETVAVV